MYTQAIRKDEYLGRPGLEPGTNPELRNSSRAGSFGAALPVEPLKPLAAQNVDRQLRILFGFEFSLQGARRDDVRHLPGNYDFQRLTKAMRRVHLATSVFAQASLKVLR
jgi:hypothetical protein